MHTAKHLKNTLFYQLEKLAADPSRFLFDPNKDVTRSGKLGGISEVSKIILSLETGSLKDELLKYFNYSPSTISASAFVQARSKIKYQFFQILFHRFNLSSYNEKLYKGFRLISVDGSSVPISFDPFDSETHCLNHGQDEKGYCAYHLNAAYDLLENTYHDVIIQPEALMDENGAFNELVDRFPTEHKALFIGDRGYESINSFEHVNRSGNKYLIRVKDIHSKTSITKSFDVPKGEFDIDRNKVLTRLQTNQVKDHPEIYKIMPKVQKFDFFDECPFYDFRCRIVRFKICEDTFETIFTNLDREAFPVEEIKKLYNMRWGIETSFRELQYALGLNAFHAKNRNSIKQEIYARLILYNFSQRVISTIKIPSKNRKHIYQINFTRAFHILREFIKKADGLHPSTVESLIAKEILPVRPGRSDPRKVRPKTVVHFNYRFD